MIQFKTVFGFVTHVAAGKGRERCLTRSSRVEFGRLIAVAAFATATASAHAALVSVTEEFTALTMDLSAGGYSFLQLSVNGNAYTITDPAHIFVPLSGNSVTFGSTKRLGV